MENYHQVRITNYRPIAGIILIVSGAILFLDRYLQTGWLSLLVLPAVGVFLFRAGIRMKHTLLVTAGSLFSGVGIGLLFAFNPLASPSSILEKLGFISLLIGLGWILLLITSQFYLFRPLWWTAIPGGIFTAWGSWALFSSHQWGDLALSLAVGVGLPLLVWGAAKKLIGLVIPGSLLLGIGPGVFLGWQASEGKNPLVNTGIMLVWFAVGWFLITAVARSIQLKYVWWPLIPGGILVVVGFGLYIGGDPGNAVGFISNTGSIGLIIFGLYLLLMRKGIHH